MSDPRIGNSCFSWLSWLTALVWLSGISPIVAAYQLQAGPSFAAETDLRWESFRRFTSHDGLPQNTAYALAQDSAGFVYAGTEEGVALYDGRRWKRVPFPPRLHFRCACRCLHNGRRRTLDSP